MPLDPVKPAQIALLEGPPQSVRDGFLALERTEANHAAALAGLAQMQRVEAPLAMATAVPLTFPLTIAAWNLERCYAVEASAALIEAQNAAIALLSEVDNGMARTGQRHTARDLAAALGMSYAFGVEFLELDLGAETELEFCADDVNRHGFHGNALAARAVLHAPVMIRIDEHGHWFTPESPAPRIGTRCAIAAAIETEAGPLFAVSVHLENRGNAAYRERQMTRLIEAVEPLAGDAPIVIGGDFNTGLADGGDFEKETLFAMMADRGFARHGGPLDQMTTRRSRVSRNPSGAYKLDWFLTRGLIVEHSRIVPAVAPDGDVLSDHDMVVVTITGLLR